MKMKPKLGVVSSTGAICFKSSCMDECREFMHYQGLKHVPHAHGHWISEGFFSVPDGCARKQGLTIECGFDGAAGVPSSTWFEASYTYVLRPEMTLTQDRIVTGKTRGSFIHP